MPRRAKLEAKETVDGWKVEVPPDMTPDGIRQRRFFPTKTAANKFAADLRSKYHKGERGRLLKVEEAIQAAEAMKILAPTGLSLLDAARAAVTRWEAEQSGETFAERFVAFTTKMQAHWRPRYASDMAKIPRWVDASFMGSRACDITPAVIRAAVMRGGAVAESTIDMRATRIQSVISARGGKRRSKRVALLDRKQLALLKWRSRKNPEERRAVGMLLFAGIRPDAEEGEITRLEWSAVGREVYVDHDVSKTGSDRHIPITKRLQWWIRGHPADGLVAPAGWRKRWQRLRAEAGLGSGQDLTRHTFASHFLAVHGEKETKQALGHTADSDTLFRHYRKAVTGRDGKRYFGER